MEEMIESSLKRWIQLTSDIRLCGLQTTGGDLSGLRTGASVDQEAGLSSASSISLTDSELVKVKLATTCVTASQTNNQAILTCDGHLVDVPADGDCGFHAICNASFPYGGRTFLGTEMPSTPKECRELLVQFITRHRQEIEDAVVSSVGVELAASYLWSDVSGRQARRPTPGSVNNYKHAQLCNSLPHGGMMGHWLGAGIGDAEMHMLGRALGVTVHCVMAALDEEGKFCLRQTIRPYPWLWSGALHGSPKGAVVVRFMGGCNSGHYQIVRCGRKVTPFIRSNAQKTRRRNKRSTPSTAPKTRKNKKRKMERDFCEEEFERDVSAVYRMHGVQPQTRERYFTDYGLVDTAFKSLMKRQINPLDLENNGSHVVRTIMAVLLQRCGPKQRGYENLSAKATGRVILAVVGTWYKDHGKSFNENQTTVVDGNSVRGPPWKAQQVLEFKQSLMKMQAKTRSVLERKAYQLTHDDVAAAMRYNVAQQLGVALDPSFSPGTNPNVQWLPLQIALMVVAAF